MNFWVVCGGERAALAAAVCSSCSWIRKSIKFFSVDFRRKAEKRLAKIETLIPCTLGVCWWRVARAMGGKMYKICSIISRQLFHHHHRHRLSNVLIEGDIRLRALRAEQNSTHTKQGKGKNQLFRYHMNMNFLMMEIYFHFHDSHRSPFRWFDVSSSLSVWLGERGLMVRNLKMSVTAMMTTRTVTDWLNREVCEWARK